MGIRVIEGVEAGTENPYAVLFCSTTGKVLGKRISGTAEDAERFLRWYERHECQDRDRSKVVDLRRMTDEAQYQWIERWEREGRPDAPEEPEEDYYREMQRLRP